MEVKTYGQPHINKEYSSILDLSLKSDHKDFNVIVKNIVEKIFDWERNNQERTERKIQKRTIKSYTYITKIFLLNLYCNHKNTPQKCIAIHRNKQRFDKDTHYNKIGISYSSFIAVLEYLVSEQLVAHSMGNNHRISGRGRSLTSRIIQTDKLVALFDDGYAFKLLPSEFLRPKKLNRIDVKQKLNDGGYTVAETSKKPTLAKKKTDLKKINKHIQKQEISIELTEGERKEAETYTIDYYNKKTGELEEIEVYKRLDIKDSILHRVYNSPELDKGGRFYGAWWIGIRKRFRKQIKINGNSTKIYDFKALHIMMLYHQEKLKLQDDPYIINGISDEYRAVIKTIFQQAINAKKKYRSQEKKNLPMGWTTKQIIDQLKENHDPIKHHMNSGIGIKLQKLDSDICELILKKSIEENIAILPIHDGFIVEDIYGQSEITEIMLNAYEQVMKTRQIEIDIT